MVLASLTLALTPALPAHGADEGSAPAVTIDAETCRRLVRHIPDPDVTYRPGVDVRGRPVAPADLHDYSAFESLVPDTVTFHVVLDPFERTGIAPPKGIESPGMVLGTVGYDINRGTFTINGRPVTTSQEDALLRACRLGLSGRVGPGAVIYPPGYDGPRLPGPKPSP
ncbi:hypothetical protein [uncultured Rhodospira sp.]|uniref:hypothetical protein n=1 Tax=uncultured Rhodospira sp. TaxID=1936189 RepID=UPI00260456A4|nr:hypothetical protein [uncultured Rhodospira sp.]